MREDAVLAAVGAPGSTSSRLILVTARVRLPAEVVARLLARHGLDAVHAVFEEAGEIARRRRPSTVLVYGDERTDLAAAALASISSASPDARLVLLTDTPVADAADRPGADVVASSELSVRGLIALLRNETVPVRPAALRRRTPDSGGRETQAVRQLTRRETQILRSLMAGEQGGDIAAHLRISPHTLRTHIQNILGKLGARTRLEAATIGLRAGLTPSPLTEVHS